MLIKNNLQLYETEHIKIALEKLIGAEDTSDFDLNKNLAPFDIELRDAAVLIPIVTRPNGLHVILTKRSDNLKGPVASGLLEQRFETQLDSASNTEVLSDNDTRTAKAFAQLEDLPEKRKKKIQAKIKKIGGLTTGLVGIIAAGTASAARLTGTDAGNATADYIDAGMEAYVDNVTMRGYKELGADREKMLGSDLSLAEDVSRGIIPDTLADVAGLAGLISGG